MHLKEELILHIRMALKSILKKKKPKGEVTYHKKDDGTMYCQYSYYTKFEKKNVDGFRTKKQ